MGSNNRTRISLVIALVAGLLGANAGSALADGERSEDVIYLDEAFEGWFSNGMNNDAPGACGEFAPRSDAVVWHLYADLAGVETEDIDVEDVVVSLAFGAKVEATHRVAVADGRADVWVQVRVKDAGNSKYVRQGAHTSIDGAKLYLGDEDVRIPDGVALQLGDVCYSGALGPVGEIQIFLQGLVCDGYDRFDGNQIDEASEHWDSTGGDWQLWDKIFRENAPTVKVAGKTKGCNFSASQRFAVGTSAGMANYHEIDLTTNAADGVIKLSSRDLPEAHQRALFWANEELWVQRLDNNELGAFQCYDDRLHPDNFEWILIRDYNKLPSSIACVAWNVATG
ncbi:MAG: hypothetical protein HKN91_11295 [Acidimicrobiia bacterium]|nr:hypothetical protein [Acidimicrobiia bacterium]